MKVKIVIPVLACAVAAAAFCFWPRVPSADSNIPESDAPAVAEAAPASADPTPAVGVVPTPGQSASTVPTVEEGSAQSPQARLWELSNRNDPESLRAILTELTSSDPLVRGAALTATRQFGSRDAIPYLAELADRTDDAREKVKILDAIDFLKMPSLTELRSSAAQNSPGGQ